MADRQVFFDLQDLVQLIVHYTSGELPMSTEALNLEVSALLPRMIGITVTSPDFEDTTTGQEGYAGQAPWVFRYEGKRCLTFTDKHDELKWSQPGEVEAPKRQS